MQPTVSVLIPAYNHSRYIKACLTSIAAEEYENLELLLLDDGSCDQTYELASEWITTHRSRFASVWYEKQENRGISSTLNRLASKVSGEFVAIVASDDLLVRGGLRSRIRALDSNPTALAVFGDALIIDEQGKQVHHSGALSYVDRKLSRLSSASAVAKELILRFWVPGPTLMMRKSALDPVAGIGLWDETLAHEDVDMYLRLVAKHALIFIPETVAAYRIREKSLTEYISEAQLRDTFVRPFAQNRWRFKGFEKLAIEVSLGRAMNYEHRGTWRYWPRRIFYKSADYVLHTVAPFVS